MKEKGTLRQKVEEIGKIGVVIDLALIGSGWVLGKESLVKLGFFGLSLKAIGFAGLYLWDHFRKSERSKSTSLSSYASSAEKVKSFHVPTFFPSSHMVYAA